MKSIPYFAGIILGLFLPCISEIRGDEVYPARWAVLAPSPLDELLTAELSKKEDVELVERTEIAAALKELGLSASLGNATATKRLSLCSLLHADRLLVVSDAATNQNEPTMGTRRVRVFDSQFGALLSNAEITHPENSPENAVKGAAYFVDEVQDRFSNGIAAIVGVSYFVSKNFDRSFDFLQEDYANIVTRSLLLRPGIAVVALEELNAIQRELTISGDKDKLFGRTVPVFLEGEYTVHSPATADQGEAGAFSNSNGISLNVVIKGAQSDLVKFEKTKITPKEVAEFLSVTVPDEIAKKIGDTGSTVSFSVAQQIAEFKKQAGRIAAVGAVELALRYREAVFLLDPNDTENALRLLVPFGEGLGPITDRYRALPYIEYLLHNGKLSLPQGTQLVDSVMRSTWVPFRRAPANQIRIYENDPLAIGDDVAFFRRLIPRVFELPMATKKEECHLNDYFVRTYRPHPYVFRIIHEYDKTRWPPLEREPKYCQMKALLALLHEHVFPRSNHRIPNHRRLTATEISRIKIGKEDVDFLFACHMKISPKTVLFSTSFCSKDDYLALLRGTGDREYSLHADVLEIGRDLPSMYAQPMKHLTEREYRQKLEKVQNLLKEHDPQGTLSVISDDIHQQYDRPDAFGNLLRSLKLMEKNLATLYIPSLLEGRPIEITTGGPKLRGDQTPSARMDRQYSGRMEEIATRVSLWLYPPASNTIPSNRAQRYDMKLEGTHFLEVGQFVYRGDSVQLVPVERYNDPELSNLIANRSRNRHDPMMITQWDERSDVLWNEAHLFRLTKTESGTLQCERMNWYDDKPSVPKKRFIRVRSDGRNLWIATPDGIDMVSPEGRFLARFSASGDLPPFETQQETTIQVSYPTGKALEIRDQHDPDNNYRLEDDRTVTTDHRTKTRYTLSVFPTAPDEALALGKGGPLGQTWIGKLTVDEKTGKKSFKLLLGTTRHLPTEDYLKPEVLDAPDRKDVVFSFPWICPFPDSKHPQRRQILVGRAYGDAYQFGAVPLLVDLDTEETMVLTQRYPDLHDLRRGIAVRCVNDCLVVCDGNQSLSVHYRGDDGLYRREEIKGNRSNDYFLYVKGTSVFSPPGSRYPVATNYPTLPTLCIDLADKKPKIESLAINCPANQASHRCYAQSANFGIALTTKGFLGHYGLYRMETLTGKATVTESPFKGVVPDDLLEKHDAAVKRILELGGKIRWWDGYPFIRLPSGQKVPGAEIAFGPDWKGTDADLALLKDIFRLGAVYFNRAPVGDAGFAHLYGISTINTLYFLDSPISEEAIRKFPLKQLVALHLEDVSTPPRYSDKIIVESLGEAPNLEELFLAGKGFTNQSRYQVWKMRKKPKLHIFNTSISSGKSEP